MRIIIQTPEFQPRQSLLDLVQQKVGKLELISDRLLEARVTLKIEKSDTDENKVCEIKGVIAGNDLFAEKRAASFEEACAIAVEAMRKQLVAWKNKMSPA